MTNTDLITTRTSILSLSQQELANKLGVAVTTVSRWETGIRPISKSTELAINYLIHIKSENSIFTNLSEEKQKEDDATLFHLAITIFLRRCASLDLSQAEAAKQLQVSVQTLTNWKNSTIPHSPLSVISRMMQIIGETAYIKEQEREREVLARLDTGIEREGKEEHSKNSFSPSSSKLTPKKLTSSPLNANSILTKDENGKEIKNDNTDVGDLFL